MFQPGSVIAGRYQVVRLVGQGGMSNLYLAYDRKYSNATVVVKEMTASYSDPKEQQMAVDLFHREAKLLASLNHRHIPKVFDYFQYAGKYYLSMEFIDGEDLAQKLEATKGPLPEKQVLEWGEQIATVLFYLHKHDPPIVFRDVKPSNIMLCAQGVKLIDFGIARHFDQAKKGDTMRIGSPGYAPPEQYAAQTDPRSDIYSLGVTLHHALTGRDPTGTQTPFLVPPAKSLNPALSEATSAMLARATQLDPSDRYQNILEMKKDIKQILNRGKQSTRVVGAPPAPPTTTTQAPPSSSSAASQVAAAAQVGSSTPAAAVQAQSTQGSSQTLTTAQASGSTSSGGSQALAGATSATSGASGSGNLGGTSNSGAAPVSQAATGKRGKGLGWLLLAALVLGPTLYFFFGLDPQTRQNFLEEAKRHYSSWRSQVEMRHSPEQKLRDALITGDPSTLMAELQGSGSKDLSASQQTLYGLNLLALEARENENLLVQILYPVEWQNTQSEEEIWRGAAGAVSALNGQGGVDRRLLTCLPQAYSAEQLPLILKEAATSWAENPEAIRVLVLSEETPANPEDLPPGFSPIWLKLDSQTSELSWKDQNLTLPGNFGDIMQSKAQLEPGDLHWGATTLTLDGWLATSPPSLELSDTELERLLSEARANEKTLFLETWKPSDLNQVSASGSLLLFAVTPTHLPKLPRNLDGDALVLWSPFIKVDQESTAVQPGREAKFGLLGAAVFDLCAILGLDGRRYNGLLLDQDSGRLREGLTLTSYRWSGESWSPKNTEKEARES